MSGPKVVRVVTREEVIATCEARLTDLREAVSRWEKVGKRNDLLTDDEVANSSFTDCASRLLSFCSRREPRQPRCKPLLGSRCRWWSTMRDR